MILKVGNRTLLFIIEETKNDSVTERDLLYCIQEKSKQLFNNYGVRFSSVEITVFTCSTEKLVFVSAISVKHCLQMFLFSSSEELISAYLMLDQTFEGELIYYSGQYYAALFQSDDINLLLEYAQPVSNAENYYTFLLEHGKLISKEYLF